MTEVKHYPARDIAEDQDLEAFFIMRMNEVDEDEARGYLSINDMNTAVEEYLRERSEEHVML